MDPWKFIEPSTINPNVFGLIEVYAVKVRKHRGDGDVRCFSLEGWRTHADLIDRDPRTGKQLAGSQWFIFAAKGR